LVALKVKLGLAARQPEEADLHEALVSLQADADEAIDALRKLARGIYPPLLADEGLGAALEADARKAPVAVTVEANGIRRYPQDVEAAVYFCCLEALQNAMKHAGPAATVVVRVWEEAGALRFAVTDDGVGLDPAAKATGAGFVNMRDRLGAIGGSLRVQSSPGAGTSVLGVLPLTGQTI
jgi:signal transduction histidine kinase